MNAKNLGRYELVRVLGKGAMGLVYEGRDPNLDRRVAIKTIKVDNLSEAEAAEYEVRFRTEARSAARLQHPNIVSVYDSDRDKDIAFLVMEFIQGDDLKHHLDKGQRYSLQQAVGIMGDLLSALDYAHRQNIVHRDIKPANLLIEASGRIKLTDFGVARIQDSGEATRTKGTMVGTLKYMAPEQVLGLAVDSRADLFAAGIVLYQLLTGTRPFDGTGDYEITQKIVERAVDAPSTINPRLPPEIDLVVARALEKSPDDRYPTAQDFNTALQAAARLATDATITPPASGPRAPDSSTWTSTMGRGDSLINTSSVPGSGSGLPSSTVTQEVELVYWKEIKDSTDPEEFQDFLGKFPSGIYSDLARRRLKRLVNPAGTSSGSETGTRTHQMVTRAAATPAATSTQFEATRVSLPSGSGAADAQTSASSAARVSTESSPGQTTRTSLTLSRKLVLALAGLVILGGIGLTYQSLSGPSEAVPGVEAAATEQDADVASKENPLSKPPDKDATSKAKAATPARPAPPPKAVAVKPAPAPRPAKPQPAPQPAKNSVQAEAPKPAPVEDPAKECQGRILLGYLTCMQEQCDKPTYAQHPTCVERRAMERRNRSNL